MFELFKTIKLVSTLTDVSKKVDAYKLEHREDILKAIEKLTEIINFLNALLIKARQVLTKLNEILTETK